jgi:hypothetical protein
VPALRTLRLRYPAHTYLQAMRREETPAAPRPRETRLIVYRRGYAMLHLAMPAAGYALFEELAKGSTLAEGLDAMQGAGGGSPRRVFLYFRMWFGEGLFSSVSIS